jgi:hypothetical protein
VPDKRLPRLGNLQKPPTAAAVTECAFGARYLPAVMRVSNIQQLEKAVTLFAADKSRRYALLGYIKRIVVQRQLKTKVIGAVYKRTYCLPDRNRRLIRLASDLLVVCLCKHVYSCQRDYNKQRCY